MSISCRIDFEQPLDAAAPRLRQAFAAPLQVLVAHDLSQVRAVLDSVQAAAQRGCWCVGHVRYEAAAAFDPALQTHCADGPLAWFSVHSAPLPWPEGEAMHAASDCARLDWQPGLGRAQFDAALARIAQAIAAGELYQVNYTAPLCGSLHGGSADALFAALRRAQPGGYAAQIDAGGEVLLSVSPELFFDWQDAPGGGRILARPMKGTAARGATPQQDAANAAQLRSAPKERAENVMIVDLLRNDLARIALAHSVQVPVLFATQALPTVWQMTSDVRARTRPGTTLADVFAALFPCGSVTGAPKVRAMEMIRQLERAPRGVYCGAIGVVRPAGPAAAGDGRCALAATFNVPIRTVVLRAQRGRVHASCAIGSGITADAQGDCEWREWQHKRAFVERASAPFELLETMALDGGRLRNWPEHLERLQRSAAHFGVPLDAGALRECLRAAQHAHPAGLWRLRLLLDSAGRPRAEVFALQATAQPLRLALAGRAFDAAHSEFVRHKTTRRAHYAAFAPTAPGLFDTLLWNEAGEITECTTGNIAAHIDGRWLTPPPDCGLLPGVGRALALRDGRVSQAVLRLADIARVQRWAFINSLRGWLDARLESPSPD